MSQIEPAGETPRPIGVGLVGYGFAGQTFHAPVLAAVASSQPDKMRRDWPPTWSSSPRPSCRTRLWNGWTWDAAARVKAGF
ncbi:MAG: hypothetical protein QM586_01545 [Xenophilus sp.]